MGRTNSCVAAKVAQTYDWVVLNSNDVNVKTETAIISTDKVIATFKYKGQKNDVYVVGDTATAYQANDCYLGVYNNNFIVSRATVIAAADTLEHTVEIDGANGTVKFDGATVLSDFWFYSNSSYSIGYRGGTTSRSSDFDIHEVRIYDNNGNTKLWFRPVKIDAGGGASIGMGIDAISGYSCVAPVYND